MLEAAPRKCTNCYNVYTEAGEAGQGPEIRGNQLTFSAASDA